MSSWAVLTACARLLQGDRDALEACAADWPGTITVLTGQCAATTIDLDILDDSRVQPEIRAFFAGLKTLNADRNVRLMAALDEALPAFAAAGVEPVLLKGAAALATGLHSHVGDRMMSDIDLLVPADHLAVAIRVLESIGHRALPGTNGVPPPLPFDRPRSEVGRRAGQPIGREDGAVWFEIHSHIVDAAHGGALAASDLFAASQPIVRGRWPARVLAPPHQLLHNAVHRQIVDEGYALRHLELRQLDDFVRLARRHGTVALADAHGFAVKSGWGAAFDGWVDLANALLGANLPVAGPGRGFANKVARQYNDPRPRVLIDPGHVLRRLAANPALALNLVNPSAWRRLKGTA